MKIDSISVVGLGKLGLCMAACFASKGYKVVGIDIDKNKIDLINRGINPIQETGLTRLIQKYKENLKATSDYEEAILNSQITFIVVATPSEADGSFSNEQLEEALKKIGLILKKKKQYHLVVITSTVMPGTTEHVGRYILEEASGKKCGKDFGLAYNPEFIALGSVIHDFLNPDFVLIGEMNKKDGDILVKIYENICENTLRFARMNPINAEIAKISLNCYITTKITFANFLGAICEKVPGANAEVITQALGLDSRIGSKYLKPGLGYGGPCFPRDNLAFSAFVRKLNMKAKLAEVVDEVNKEQVARIVAILEEIAKRKRGVRIGILGLSYKPNTPIIEDSQAIDIVEILIKKGYDIIVYDPMALEIARGVFGDEVGYARSTSECIEKSDVVLIATPWKEFEELDFKKIKHKDIVILDCWRIVRDKGLKIKYLGIGEQLGKGEEE
ncbi:MAG: UDP-glucose/GDP-mannose dehydrogenase family protein [Candidatus Omnitrophota bacterium]|nr:MAG: UDP-glucose/GDP-mannose dehydrogenase family protein [Candidatus Omnitrophota bacterium]